MHVRTNYVRSSFQYRAMPCHGTAWPSHMMLCVYVTQVWVSLCLSAALTTFTSLLFLSCRPHGIPSLPGLWCLSGQWGQSLLNQDYPGSQSVSQWMSQWVSEVNPVTEGGTEHYQQLRQTSPSPDTLLYLSHHIIKWLRNQCAPFDLICCPLGWYMIHETWNMMCGVRLSLCNTLSIIHWVNWQALHITSVTMRLYPPYCSTSIVNKRSSFTIASSPSNTTGERRNRKEKGIEGGREGEKERNERKRLASP